MNSNTWNLCLRQLEEQLSAQEFNTWIRPLHVYEDQQGIHLLAPNRFVQDWVRRHFFPRITALVKANHQNEDISIMLQVGSRNKPPQAETAPTSRKRRADDKIGAVRPHYASPLNHGFTFQNFVSGHCNQLARAAAEQTAACGEFNPLYIYGGAGLGKTHLMQAVGHCVLRERPDAKVVYLHSERFVANMVKALQNKSINEFKNFYRNADVLLVDDVQFLSGKLQSQEEFMHTFNNLMDAHRQLVLTCDRAPKQVGMDNRLQSRLGSGLTVEIAPPEQEARINILLHKAQQMHFNLPEEVAVFIAEHIESSVRELEGALKRLLASARLLNESITVDHAAQVLKDLLSAKQKVESISDIQQAVADYFKISPAEINSKSRRRIIVRPRQIAMNLAKELTEHSLPEIGQAFGGRDRTTVLHSCKAVDAMKEKDSKGYQDYLNLLRLLS